MFTPHENLQKYNEIKEKAENFYKNIVEVYCPYFQENVAFNAKGLEHLKFKSRNYARPKADQCIRFKILKYAPKILQQTRTLQGVSEENVFELNRSNHKNELLLVEAVFYEFIAVLDKVRVRVIVKQINGGPKYFWSVIPFWKKSNNSKRRLHYGSPGED